jgi:hypothetical protein
VQPSVFYILWGIVYNVWVISGCTNFYVLLNFIYYSTIKPVNEKFVHTQNKIITVRHKPVYNQIKSGGSRVIANITQNRKGCIVCFALKITLKLYIILV